MNQRFEDVIATFVNQAWRLISGPLTMVLIPLLLSESQQGYWYLFGSLSALSIFADLGFSNIILQFSAHEFAFLTITEDDEINGDPIHIDKAASLLNFVLKWVITICTFVFPIILCVGYFFLNRDNVLTQYWFPWTIFIIGSLINFITNAIYSFFEGFNKIAAIQNIRFVLSITNTIVVLILLLFKCNIYALAVGSILSAGVSVFFLVKKFLKLLRQLFSKRNNLYNWNKEILPLFFKYALSFSSGYFIFQIYTPLMHYFHGPENSGRVGITMSLVTAIFSMSNVWMYTVIPQMNITIAKGDWNILDNLFKKRFCLSIASYLIIIIGVCLFLYVFGNYWLVQKIISRFLPLESVLMLVACYFMQLCINSWALYLRGHKEEPYVVLSIVSAVWILITTYLLGRFVNSKLFFSGFFSSYFWNLPLSYIVFAKCKRKWHGKE